MAGDLVYFWIPTPDVERAERFYGELLGWEFAPGNVPEGRQITNVTPPGGLHGGEQAPSLTLCFEVDDLEAAGEKVRELGGEAGDSVPTEAGHYAECRDDQGTGFCLWAASNGG
jgi:predicted enzyme related to lactoylglutathione lyase